MRKSFFVVVFILTISLAITTASAQGGGHLWFYSVDPDDLTDPITSPGDLPNPQDEDPNWVGSDPDPWLSESIVIPPDGWEGTFRIWLACHQFESLDTKLVVSINEAAHAGIEIISIEGEEVTSWDTSGVPPGCLAPHGVFNSAEFYGYALIDGELPNVGDLYSPGTPSHENEYAVEIEIEITLLTDADTSGMKIHFDAFGVTEGGKCIFSPYSHDLTVVPELGTILLAAASFSAFALYALKRRK